MGVFVEKDIFNKDYSRPGLPIRNLLRKLDAENKLDLLKTNNSTTINTLTNSIKSMRRVSLEKVSSYVEENNINYWVECSAKTGENIEETFKRFYTGNLINYSKFIYILI